MLHLLDNFFSQRFEIALLEGEVSRTTNHTIKRMRMTITLSFWFAGGRLKSVISARVLAVYQ
jgi:hypothetical protein